MSARDSPTHTSLVLNGRAHGITPRIFFSNMDFGNDLKSSCLQGKHSMDLTISRTTESQTYWLPGSSPVLRSSVRPRTWKDGDGMMGPVLPPGGQMRDKHRKNCSLLGWHDATGLVDWRL